MYGLSSRFPLRLTRLADVGFAGDQGMSPSVCSHPFPVLPGPSLPEKGPPSIQGYAQGRRSLLRRQAGAVPASTTGRIHSLRSAPARAYVCVSKARDIQGKYNTADNCCFFYKQIAEQTVCTMNSLFNRLQNN